eukprot:4101252-Pleurochrysis_carterae.AAC.1
MAACIMTSMLCACAIPLLKSFVSHARLAYADMLDELAQGNDLRARVLAGLSLYATDAVEPDSHIFRYSVNVTYCLIRHWESGDRMVPLIQHSPSTN